MKNMLDKFMPGVLFTSLFVWFFTRTRSTNISADDAGFLQGYATGTFNDWYNSLVGYVPGRNLHILWQNSLLFLTGTSVGDFWKYHFIQSLAYTLVFVFVYFIIRNNGGKKTIALVVGIGMALFPLYTSVLLWASALPMHLISTLFLLLGLNYLTKGLADKTARGSKGTVPGALFLSLAMFTYDQAAAVVLLITLLVICAQFSGYFKLIIPLNSTKKLAVMLVIVSVFYLLVFFAGRGTGNNLTVGSGTLDRLSGNILLPIKAYLKIRGGFIGGYSIFQMNPYIALFINLAIFVAILAICFVLLKRRRLGTPLNTSSLLSAFLFLFLAAAAYLPSAIWYVSPRHLFLPVVLGSVFIGLVLSEFLRVIEIRSWIKVIAILCFSLLLMSSSLGVNQQINRWESRDAYRINFYNSLDSQAEKLGYPCFIIGQELNNTDTYLYSENINAALKFYQNRGQESKPSCNVPASQQISGEFLCQDSNKDSWYEIQKYNLKSDDTENDLFQLVEIC